MFIFMFLTLMYLSNVCAMDEELSIVTPLPVERFEEFKNLRLEAVQQAPQAIGGSLATEQKHDDEWYKNILQLASNEKTEWFVFAEKGKEIIGMAGAICKMKHIDECRHMATIVSVYVQPEHRKKGVAYALMETLMQKLRDSDFVTQVMLYVTSTEDQAVKLYEKCGFIKKGELAEAVIIDGNFYNQFLMQRSVIDVADNVKQE